MNNNNSNINNNNNSGPFYFDLTLFTDQGALRYLSFTLCLLLYAAIVSVNVVIILTICLERSLHQPMYIFISCLSVNSLYGSAGFFPRFMVDLLSDTHLISRPACFIQIYVIYTYAAYELTIMSAMAFDRYIAICQPLHYHSKMSFRVVRNLLILPWFYLAFGIAFCVSVASHLPLCGNKLHRVFCGNWSVVRLSCVDTTLNNIAGRFLTITTIFLPLIFVLFTYLRILLVCRRSSSEFRGKALQTCLPHIVTYVNYSVTIFCELLLSRFEADEINPLVAVVLSLEFLIIPPISNPLVYGLNLPQIRGIILKFLKIPKMVPAG